MSLFRVALVASASLLATLFSSAAFAGCCGGCGGCGGAYVVGYTYAPAIPVAPPVVYAPVPVPAPVAPIPIAPAPIAVDHWDTGGWGGWNGWGGGWNGWGNWGGGCGCCCNRGLFTSGYFGGPAVAPIYIVNQGPQYSGPGIMIPSLNYSQGFAATGAYPYVGRYPYRPYYPRYYMHHVHHYYWHRTYPLHSRG